MNLKKFYDAANLAEARVQTIAAQIDDLMEKARRAMGEERRTLWRAAFKRAHEEVVPYVMLFHRVGYARVGKRIDYKPSLATNSEIQVAQITFK